MCHEHRSNQGVQTGLLVQRASWGHAREAGGAGAADVFQMAVGRTGSRKSLSSLGTRALGRSLLRIKEPGARILCFQVGVVGAQVSSRGQRDTEARVHAGQQGQLQWVVPGRAGTGSFAVALWGWGFWVGQRTQAATAFPEHCLPNLHLARGPAAGPGRSIRSHLCSFCDPPGSTGGAQAQIS